MAVNEPEVHEGIPVIEPPTESKLDEISECAFQNHEAPAAPAKEKLDKVAHAEEQKQE